MQSTAHSDFVTVRLNGKDTTGTQTLSASPISSNNSGTSKKKSVYLILAIVAISAAVLLAIGLFLFRRFRGGKAKGAQWGTYRQIASPAPTPQVNMQPMSSAPPQYNPQYGQPLYDPPQYQHEYGNPWDHRH